MDWVLRASIGARGGQGKKGRRWKNKAPMRLVSPPAVCFYGGLNRKQNKKKKKRRGRRATYECQKGASRLLLGSLKLLRALKFEHSNSSTP